MNHWHREPTITEILSDSIVRSLMQADGVDPDELESYAEAYGRRANHGPVACVVRLPTRSDRNARDRPSAAGTCGCACGERVRRGFRVQYRRNSRDRA
jgi:hypothetical protein